MVTAAARELAVERTLTQRDFDRFAALSGDDNPIHVDPDFSARTRFGRTVAHGLLLSTVLHGLIDRLLPGGRLSSQALTFLAPTYTDEPMRFAAAITARDDDGVHVRLTCERLADGTATCEGTALVDPTSVHPAKDRACPS